MISLKKKNAYQWRKYVVTYLDYLNSPKVSAEVTTKSEKEFLKGFTHVNSIISIHSIDGKKKSDEKCLKCGKPFVIGDKILCHNFHEHEIVFMDRHLAYFDVIYTGEDYLDSHEQLRYIVHSCHANQPQIDQYRKGKQLWKEGMDMCAEATSKLFK